MQTSLLSTLDAVRFFGAPYSAAELISTELRSLVQRSTTHSAQDNKDVAYYLSTLSRIYLSSPQPIPPYLPALLKILILSDNSSVASQATKLDLIVSRINFSPYRIQRSTISPLQQLTPSAPQFPRQPEIIEGTQQLSPATETGHTVKSTQPVPFAVSGCLTSTSASPTKPCDSAPSVDIKKESDEKKKQKESTPKKKGELTDTESEKESDEVDSSDSDDADSADDSDDDDDDDDDDKESDQDEEEGEEEEEEGSSESSLSEKTKKKRFRDAKKLKHVAIFRTNPSCLPITGNLISKTDSEYQTITFGPPLTKVSSLNHLRILLMLVFLLFLFLLLRSLFMAVHPLFDMPYSFTFSSSSLPHLLLF